MKNYKLVNKILCAMQTGIDVMGQHHVFRMSYITSTHASMLRFSYLNAYGVEPYYALDYCFDDLSIREVCSMNNDTSLLVLKPKNHPHIDLLLEKMLNLFSVKQNWCCIESAGSRWTYDHETQTEHWTLNKTIVVHCPFCGKMLPNPDNFIPEKLKSRFDAIVRE